MLKVRTENTVLLGLDKENIKRLKAGKPIFIKGESLNIDVDIAIAYGDSLADIAKEYNIPMQH